MNTPTNDSHTMISEHTGYNTTNQSYRLVGPPISVIKYFVGGPKSVADLAKRYGKGGGGI